MRSRGEGGTTASRVGDRPLRSGGRVGRDRRAALALAGWISAIAAASFAVRRAGAPEPLVGGALAVLVATGFAGFVVRRLQRAGEHPARAVGWGVAILCASASPTLVSVFPGRVTADATVRSPGDAVPLPAAAHGRVRVLVSAVMPEKAFVAFSFRTDHHALVDGTLSRGVRSWNSGEERGHYHEERTSVLLAGETPPRASALVLENVGGDPVPLRVRVFVPPFPAWAATLLSVFVMVAFGLLHPEKPREEAIVAAACVGGCSGLFAGATATPDAALGSVLAGVVLGALTGVPLAVVLRAAGRPILRRASGYLRATTRREGRP